MKKNLILTLLILACGNGKSPKCGKNASDITFHSPDGKNLNLPIQSEIFR